MKIIKQYEFGPADVLKVEDRPVPTIKNGHVLIKGAYTSINYADIKKRIGTKNGGHFPFTLGLDIAGTVVESKSELFRKGDRVIAFSHDGTYSQFIVANETLTYKIPQHLHFEQAAAMPTVSLLAAILVEKIAKIKTNDTVVIHSAAGGVGSMLVQLCKKKNCLKIIGTVSSLSKANYVKRLGADVVCTYEEFTEITLNETNNLGATVIFDSVAGTITTDSLKCLAPFGTLVQFGNSSGNKGHFTTNDVHSSCRNVKGFSLGTTRKMNPDFIRPYAEQMIRKFSNNEITLNVDRIFNLEEIVEAHQYFERRNHNGKILLKLN